MLLSNKLLKWYYHQNIQMPWRANTQPYRIWISEIMLQQTQVNTVIPYYNKWMKKYPTVKDLSKAALDDLLYLWQGLGYYNRVESIYKASKIIQKNYNGEIPNSYEKLITLPGIGDYTASAILSIAYNQYIVPIDGNIKRIVARFNHYATTSNKLDEYKEYTKRLINKNKIGDSIQGLMDLGRTICKPKIPICNVCPINRKCLSHISGDVDKYPQKKLRKQIPTYNVVVGLIMKNKKFLISKRPKKGLLSNLWELPGGKMKLKENKKICLKREIKEETDIQIKILNEVGTVKHQYSHFGVIITLFKCQYVSGIAKPHASQDVKWISFNQKKQFAFPKATHKLFQLINR